MRFIIGCVIHRLFSLKFIIRITDFQQIWLSYRFCFSICIRCFLSNDFCKLFKLCFSLYSVIFCDTIEIRHNSMMIENTEITAMVLISFHFYLRNILFAVIVGHQIAVHTCLKVDCEKPLDVCFLHSCNLKALIGYNLLNSVCFLTKLFSDFEVFTPCNEQKLPCG